MRSGEGRQDAATLLTKLAKLDPATATFKLMRVPLGESVKSTLIVSQLRGVMPPEVFDYATWRERVHHPRRPAGFSITSTTLKRKHSQTRPAGSLS